MWGLRSGKFWSGKRKAALIAREIHSLRNLKFDADKISTKTLKRRYHVMQEIFGAVFTQETTREVFQS